MATSQIRIRRGLARAARVARSLARDPRLPRPVRWLLMLSLLPVPGPFDELAGLLVLGLIALWWRPVLREALTSSAQPTPSHPGPR